VVTGAVTVLVWNYLEGGWFDLYEILPGFLFSAGAIYIFSMRSEPPSRYVTDKMDGM
jgi:sodium/proline symporter